MPSEGGRRALLGILQNIELARSFLGNLTAETFAADQRTIYAVTRCLEIISEASRRVDPETRERHPHIPWREMAAAGNVYRHRYDILSPVLLWQTVQGRLPEIEIVCRAELACD